MTDTAASFDDATFSGGREFAFGEVHALIRGVLGSAAMGFGAIAAIGATIGVTTVGGVWMVGVALSSDPHLQTRVPAGPAKLALADVAAFPKASFEAKWARTTAVMSAPVRHSAPLADSQAAGAGRAVSAPMTASHPHLKVKHEVEQLLAPPNVDKLMPWATSPQLHSGVLPATPRPVERIAPVPLPRAKPVRPKITQAPAEKPAAQAALVTPPSAPPVEKRAAPRKTTAKATVLPGPGSRTALYDIAGHTVYMPNGDRLEAHSGLGNKIDDPRYIKAKMRGPTPPNVYDLTLRERLFHGVRAIRLTPVDENKMFGRDGMLAHTYMLGPNGQSNGCVSFKDYPRFLHAFLNGEVDRMVVVRNLDEAPPHLAGLTRAHRGRGYRYAANNVGANPASW
jgi:hypothetical protein